jgi:adenine phosphoribosyltransferase
VCLNRRERVIHTLDGLEAPVAPATLAAAGAELWDRLGRALPAIEDRTDFLLGLDAGGILPTVTLASASELPYKIAWMSVTGFSGPT